MKKLLIAATVILGLSSASAQDITNHAMPVGGGPGAVGWKQTGPCGPGQVPTWVSGATADPICGNGPSVTLFNNNYLVNGDFSQWTLCPEFNCTLTLTDGVLTGQSGYSPSITQSLIEAYPDSWLLSGTGYGGATTWRMRQFIPTNQVAVEGFPSYYSATTWTTLVAQGSFTEQTSSCPGPDATFGTIFGCRSSFFDTSILREYANYGFNKTFTFSVNARVGRRITNAQNNGANLCRLTVSTTSGMTTGQSATVAGIAGATTCNGAGGITVINGTTVDFNATFTGSFDSANSDALINNQPVYLSPILYISLSYQSYLVGQFPSLSGGYVTNTGSDGQFYLYQAAGTGTTGRAITAVANNGVGLCRITIDDTTNYTTGQIASVVAPGTGCWPGSFTITKIDATHIDLQASTFSGVYTGGGYIGIPPVHITKGTTVSDGNIAWTNVGFAKGRAYDLYEGQYSLGAVTSTGYSIGAAVPVDGNTTNPIGNACTITANWSKCVVTINLPPAEYNNVGDYAWSTDQPRKLLPTPGTNFNFGLPGNSSMQAAIDMIGPIGLQEVDLSNAKVEPGSSATPFIHPPKYLNELTSIPFKDKLGFTPSNADTLVGFLAQTNYNNNAATSTFARRILGSVVPNSNLTWGNGDGVAGNPILNAGGNLSTLTTVTGTGLYAITGAQSSSATRFISTSISGLSWSNADGVAGNPTLNGTLGTASGGTGTATTFTQGSIPFAGVSGIYGQDNTNFFWDNTNKRHGIGTAVPDTPLTISGNTGTTVAPSVTSYMHIIGADGVNPRMYLDAFGGVPIMNIRRANGTLAAKTAIANNDVLFAFGVEGWDSAAYYAPASINFAASQAWTNVAHGTVLTFFTTPNGSSTVTESFRANPSGGLSVGTTADPGVGTMMLKKQAFSALTACSATIEGATASVTDSSTNVWGAIIAGAGANHVLAYCNGTNWTVAAK